MFFFNFIFWLMGLLLIGIGIYAIMDKWSSGEAFKLNTIFDVIFNVGFLLLLIGVVVFIVSFAGCGLSSDGYEDWNNNEYFNCTEENPSVERCGVPYSCCHVDEDSIVPLNLMCGFEVQSTVKEKRENKAKDIAEVMAKINT